MAGTKERWRCTFDDENSNECIISIYDDEYNDDYTEVLGGPDPITIKWMGQGDDIFTHIKASEAIVQLQGTTFLQYLDVFAYGNKRFYCKFTKAGSTIWQGYSTPEFYSEPFGPVPHIIELHFTDGIGYLKNIEFAPPGYTENDQVQTVIWYIKAALNEINHQFPIWTALDLDFTSTGGGAVTSRILESMNIDWRAIRNEDGTFWNWYDVLYAVLKMFNARIYMCNGAWIVETIDQKRSTYPVEKYTYVGVYDSTVAAQDDRQALTTNSVAEILRFAHQSANLEIAPAYNLFTISQDYGHRDNLLKFNNWAGKFLDSEFDAADTPRFWTAYQDAVMRRVEDEEALQIDNIVAEPEYGSWIQSDAINIATIDPLVNTFINDWFYGKVALRVKFKVKINVNLSYHPISDFSIVRFSARVLFTFTGTNYYLKYQPSGLPPVDVAEWTTDSATGYIRVLLNENSDDDLNEWYEVDLTMTAPPVAEWGNTQTGVSFYLRLYNLYIEASNGEIGFQDGDGLMIKDCQIYFDRKTKISTDKKEYRPKYKHISKGGKPKSAYLGDITNLEIIEDEVDYTREQTFTITTDNMTSPDEITHTFGDTLNHNNSASGCGHMILNRYTLQDSTGYPINIFSKHGDTSWYPLLFVINKADKYNYYSKSQIKLRGVLKDQKDVISFRSVLQDYDSRLYVCISMSWNAKTCEFESEWQCIYPPLIALQAEDFENLLNESGGTLYA